MAAVEAVAQLDGMLLKGRTREKGHAKNAPLSPHPGPPSPVQITVIEPEHW